MIIKTTVKSSVIGFILFLFATQTGQAQTQSDQIDKLVSAYCQNHLFNGNVLVVRKGKTIFQKSYGFANMEWNIPNDRDTKFRIGSLTKQFTAMLVMQLKQEGKIELHQTVSRYLPWFPKNIGDKITVHHLLTHSSGLPNYTDSASIINDINTQLYSPPQIALKYFTGGFQFEPGTKFQYCNTGYFLLGAIIEEATKKPFAQVLRERILDPAGMKNSGMDDARQLVPHKASGYAYSFDGYTPAPFINPATATYAAGGMYSTTGDLYLWQKAIIEGRLLHQENRDLFFTPNLGNYGYGVYVAKKGEGPTTTTIIGHNGSISGFSSSMLRYVEDETIIIVIDNTRAEKRGSLENIVAGIYDILKGRKPKELVRSFQVTMISEMNKRDGNELVSLYKELESKKDAYNLSGAVDFLSNMGDYLLQKGRTTDALSVLGFLTEKYPNSYNARYCYAEALLKNGQKEAAKEVYKSLQESNPGDTNVQIQLRIIGE